MSANFIAWILGLLVIISPQIVRAGDAPLDIVANYADDKYWLGIVEPAADAKSQPVTHIYRRETGSGQLWRPYASVTARLKSIAPRGDQLAVLLENGDWMLVWPNGQSAGARPPGGKILALQSDGVALWAVAQMPQTSVEKSNAKSPTTGPMRLVLLKLDRSSWLPLYDLPGQADLNAPKVAIAIVDHVPVIAARVDDNVIVTGRYESEKTWTEVTRIDFGWPVMDFELLSTPRGVVAWVAGYGRAGAITSVNPNKISLKQLEDSRPVPAAAKRRMVVASERLRFLFNEGDQIYEQKFEFDGSPVGETAALKLPMAFAVSPLISYFHRLVMVALMFTIIAAIRKRPEIQETIDSTKKLNLAGYGARLVAGLVDALPVIITMLVIMNRGNSDSIEFVQDVTMFVPLLLSIVVYIAHITISELIGGRSIGKIIFALRVVDLRGQKPSVRAILLRNLLRIIDLYGLFALMLVLYSPLRQRAGDVAAGTIVVSESSSEEDSNSMKREDEKT